MRHLKFQPCEAAHGITLTGGEHEQIRDQASVVGHVRIAASCPFHEPLVLRQFPRAVRDGFSVRVNKWGEETPFPRGSSANIAVARLNENDREGLPAKGPP